MMYTVKNSYQFRLNIIVPLYYGYDVEFWKKTWNLQVPTKVKHFVWRACTNCLPTKMALRSKRVEVTDSCPICCNSLKDTLHALIKYHGAKDVWRGLTLGDISAHVNSFEKWWLQVLHNINTNVATMTTMTVWNLWNNRNKLVWNNKRSSASGIISSAANILSQWQHARLFSVSQRRISISNTSPRWTKPESGCGCSYFFSC